MVDDSGKLIGPPILTACVDGYSSVCMGYSLGFEGGILISIVIIVYYLFTTFTNFTNGNCDIDRTIATYVISLASIIVLFSVCEPFNLYRIAVYVGSIILTIFLFVFLIYSIEGLNLLELYPNEAPRYLEAKYVGAIIVLIAISLILFIGLYLIKKYIQKKGEIKNERN